MVRKIQILVAVTILELFFICFFALKWYDGFVELPNYELYISNYESNTCTDAYNI